MSQKTSRIPTARPGSETDEHNARLLKDRKQRLEANRPIIPDLGLKLPEKEPQTATEFLDEFDKKAYGYPGGPTITKIIWGPDPLVDNSPEFRDALDRHGREDMARLYADAILTKGASAMPDPLMAKALVLAINKFGREAVASAFCDRVLRIPFRTVEIDASDTLDPEILGSTVLSETVKRYARPGMCYFAFSQLCVDRLGWRGYTPVRENGDIVRCGTLMLGEIRQEIVEERERQNTKEAHDRLKDVGQNFGSGVESAPGVSALSEGESVTARAGVGGNDPEGYLGQTRTTGLEIGKREI